MEQGNEVVSAPWRPWLGTGTEVGFYKSQRREGTDPTEDDLHQLLSQALLQNKVTCTRLSDVFHYVTPLLRTRSLAYPQDLTFSISFYLWNTGFQCQVQGKINKSLTISLLPCSSPSKGFPLLWVQSKSASPNPPWSDLPLRHCSFHPSQSGLLLFLQQNKHAPHPKFTCPCHCFCLQHLPPNS